MTKNSKIAAALVGGYLLGRTKKAKMAIGFGMFLAGKKLDLDPRKIASLVTSSPALSGLNEQVRTELVDATKTAATTALTQRATGLADTLAQRTRALELPEDETREHTDSADADADADATDDGAAEGHHDDEAPPPKPAAKSGTDRSEDEPSGERGRAPTKRAPSPSSAAHGRPGGKRTSSRSAQSSPARRSGPKRTGGTKKRATSSVRQSGGGDHG